MTRRCVYRWWNETAYNPAPGDDVEAVTTRYLNRKKEFNLEDEDKLAEQYIQHVLPLELRFAQPHLPTLRCHTLALLVGFSLDPLFQAISVLQPERLVLILSEKYSTVGGGADRGDMIQSLMEEYLAPRLKVQSTADPTLVHSFTGGPAEAEAQGALAQIERCIVRDLPSPPTAADTSSDKVYSVFRALGLKLLEEGTGQQADSKRPVIIDITGAKKSMSAEAFMFAAYANIPISYVDFVDYDPQKRQPLGYTCRIGRLDNPYDNFALRRWEEVGRQFANGHYRAAAQTLASLKPLMVWPMFDAKHQTAVDRLLALIRFYEAWDDGDYHRALKELLPPLQKEVKFLAPQSVTELGERWPYADRSAPPNGAASSLCTGHDALQPDIFLHNKLLLSYARDELTKIEALITTNEDNRSALLRAAGLDELLLKARLVRLWHADKLEVWTDFTRRDGVRVPTRRIGTAQSSTLDTEREELFSRLREHSDEGYMRLALRDCVKRDMFRKPYPKYLKLDLDQSYAIYRTDCQPVLGDYEAQSRLSTRHLTQLRNRSIHTYLYITPSIAAEAVKLAQANLAEFEAEGGGSGWAKLAGPVLEVSPPILTWAEALDVCGVDFLPRLAYK